ncbi:MAG: hypothetical protein KC656_08590, partial [Myxococcales bacterium]|nr:hypothetical protein [Myxococcales bacterium]
EKDGTGTFTQFYTYEVDGVLVEELSTSDDYAVTGTRTGKGVWDVSIAFDEALAMTCTAEKDAMSCVSTDVTVDFTRAE